MGSQGRSSNVDRFSPRLAAALMADRHRAAAVDRRSMTASALGRSSGIRSLLLAGVARISQATRHGFDAPSLRT
jgi:hypothetical protein